MPQLEDFPPEVQQYFKANGIDPKDLVESSDEQPPAGMSKTQAATATLKGHAGSLALGGGAALGATAATPWIAGSLGLAPETGGASLLGLLVPLGAGLAGAYAGSKAQKAILPEDVEQRIQQESEQAQQEHPWVSMGTDVAASALTSGGRLSPGTIRRAISGDVGALRNIALQSGINTAVDTGSSLATEGKLPDAKSLIGDIAGGALFSEPSALGRMAHRSTSEPIDVASEVSRVESPSITQDSIGPLRMAPQESTETSPSATAESGVVQKTTDTATDNKMDNTVVSPQNPIDKKDQTVGPSGLTKAEEDELKGLDLSDMKDFPAAQDSLSALKTKLSSNINKNAEPLKDGFYATVQKDNGIPGSGYTQIDEVRNGENVRSGVPTDELQNNGIDTTNISQLEQGKHYLGDQQNAIQKQPTEEVLPREQIQTPEAGSERSGMGPSIEGTKTTEQGKEKSNIETSTIKPSEDINAQMKEAVKPPEVIPSKTDISPNKEKAGTWAVIDKVHDLNHPGAVPLADAAKQVLNERDRLIGQWKNPIVEAGRELSASDKQQLNKIKDTELSTGQLQPQMLQGASPELKRYYQLAKKLYSDNGDYRIQSGEPVYSGKLPRPLKKFPSYWAGMPDQKVEQIYRDNTDQKKIADLDAIFDKWNQQSLKMSPAGSQEMINDFKTAVRGNRGSSDISHQDYFNASRRAMGKPLPPEFREQDPVKNDTRYFDRQAIDNSHYRFLEKNPQAMAALGEKNDAWGKPINFSYKEGSLTGNEQVKSLIRQFRTDITPESQHTLNASGSLLTNMLINGPALEMHKIVSNQVGAIGQADNPYQLSRAIGHALIHINEGWEHAKAGGLVKLSASNSLDMFNGSLNAASRLNGLSKVVRDISTLGGLTTKLNAGLMQSYFESLVPSKIIRANKGDLDAQRFMRRLDPTYKQGKIYQSTEVQQLASTAAQYIHGTGDIRTMPSWMMRDNEIKGFLELAHWSVSQTTKFQHDVWEPLKRGNYTPLLTGVFGATVGGYLIKQLREQLSGKKSSIPSLSEIANSERGISGNARPLMYNAIAAMQYAGFGGLMSQIAKYPFDVVYKNRPQGATFPLDQIATDLAETTGQVASVIANDPNLNWVDLAKSVSMHILQSDIQLSRTAINQGIDSGLVTGLPAEKKQLSDKMNELRRYDMVSGLPYNDIEQGSNPYMNIEQQKFKHDPDVGEAVQMIPGLINGIIQRYGSQPDLMMAKIKALKQNVYDTMPSMESTPLQFFKYLQYLERTEGSDKAQALLEDYMKHTIGNKIKSGIVP